MFLLFLHVLPSSCHETTIPPLHSVIGNFPTVSEGFPTHCKINSNGNRKVEGVVIFYYCAFTYKIDMHLFAHNS